MTCPPEIADLLLDITQLAILRIRAAGWEKNPERCALEADHVHNLCALIRDFSTERLRYYWNIERPSFISRITNAGSASFEPLWQQLQVQVNLANGMLIKT
jgi:hypothetical protein